MGRFLVGVGAFLLAGIPSLFGQTPVWCDFWGQATFRGNPVTTSDQIKAYTPSGLLCGEAVGNQGWFNVRVYGVYEGSPYYPNGASEGMAITFKINDQTANVVSGSNIWASNGSIEISLQVPHQVQVIARPGGPYTGQEGSPVQFDGSRSQDAVTYEWRFGDGGTATGPTPTYTYADNGTYTVTLTCRNGTQSHTATTTATIANVPPQNVNAGGNRTANEGQAIAFSGSATDPGTADVASLTYTWNFGNGQTATGKNVNYAYPDNGTYTVTLTVRDKDGGQGTAQITATIANAPPTANAGGPYTGIVGVKVRFSGTATDPGSADIPTLQFAWDLNGDGVYDDGTGPNPERTYTSPGTFPVSLRVTDKDGGSSVSNTTVTISTSVQITITTNPSGRQFKADGQTYTAPQTFLWAPGSQHTLEAITQYPSAETRYVWTSWSQGGAAQQTYTTPSSPATLTANYKVQYKLTVESAYGNPQGDGWYDNGSQVTFGVTTPWSGPTGVRYVFTGWTGTGSGSYTGTDATRTITITNPVREVASWRTEYFLSTAVTPPGGGTIEPAPLGTWVAAGNTVQVRATPAQGYEWIGWSGALSGTTSPASLTMDGPKSVTAQFSRPISVTIQTDPPGLTFQVDGVSYTTAQTFQWAQGSTHVLSTTAIQTGPPGTRYVFFEWSNGGAISHELTVPNAPMIVTARFKTQYYLTVFSSYGNPTGEGWYEAGMLASFSVDSTAPAGTGIRYRFVGWTGTGNGSYTGKSRSASVLMNGPITERAEWKRQSYVTLAVDPPGSGTIQPLAPPGGWVDAEATLRLTAVGNVSQGYGFLGWTGGVTSESNPLSIWIQNPISLTARFVKGRVQVTSDPPGLFLIVDGDTVVTPRVYNWAPGSIHQLGVVSPQGDSASALYVFRSWSNGGAARRTVTIPPQETVYTAYFDAAYRVSIETDFGTPRINGTPRSFGFFPQGSRVTLSIDSLVSVTEGIRRRFGGWTGRGLGSVTGSARTIQVDVRGPLIQTVVWVSQYRVTTRKNPLYAPHAEIRLDPAGPWFDHGTEVTLSAVMRDESYAFLGWRGSVSGTSPVLVIRVLSPMEIIGHFRTPNQPPRITRIPVLEMLEDTPWEKPLDWFFGFVQDDNDPLETLRAGALSSPQIQAEVDTVGRKILLRPKPDWSGTSWVVFWVQDPIGESASDTLRIRVRQVPDPPKPFGLVAPPSGTFLNSWEEAMAFVWRRSRNVDPGDTIRYDFFFGPSQTLTGVGTFRVPNLWDTTLTIFPQVAGAYWWGVRAQDTQGHQTWCDAVFRIDIKTSVKAAEALPKAFALRHNFPNPFNPRTTVSYDLPRESEVHLEIRDLSGRFVRTLVEGPQAAGTHRVVWDGRDAQGLPVASGVYVILMQAPGFMAQHKMVLMR